MRNSNNAQRKEQVAQAAGGLVYMLLYFSLILTAAIFAGLLWGK